MSTASRWRLFMPLRSPIGWHVHLVRWAVREEQP